MYFMKSKLFLEESDIHLCYHINICHILGEECNLFFFFLIAVISFIQRQPSADWSYGRAEQQRGRIRSCNHWHRFGRGNRRSPEGWRRNKEREFNNKGNKRSLCCLSRHSTKQDSVWGECTKAEIWLKIDIHIYIILCTTTTARIGMMCWGFFFLLLRNRRRFLLFLLID